MLFIIISLSILLGACAVAVTLEAMLVAYVEDDTDSVKWISVNDLVKFADRPVFRVSSIIVNDDGQYIIVDNTSLAHVVEPNEDFVLWS